MPCAAVRVDGEQCGLALGHVGQVDPGVGAHKPVAGLGDDEAVSFPQDTSAFGEDEASAGLEVGRVDGDEAAFGLRHDLLRDNEDVVVLQGGRRREG